jgi:hypothetical protein
VTIFHEPWWLDTVTEGRWREVRVEQNGTCLGRWPYLERKGPGRLLRLTSPPLCPRLGPLLHPILEGNENLGAWSQVLGDLADRLPPHHHLLQSFDSRIQYWIPLAWRGFTQTTLFSFVVEDTADLDAVRRGYSQGTRRNYRKGLKVLNLAENGPVQPLYEALGVTLRDAGVQIGYPVSTLDRVVKETLARDRGVHLSAHAMDGTHLGGAFFVWDERSVYYLLGAATAAARGTGAQTLLLDRGIEIASSRGLRFDFEGSRVPSIEKFFRTFGSAPEPFMLLERRSPTVNVALTLREALRSRRESDRSA